MSSVARAWSLVRSLPEFRAEAFRVGLRAAGYDVQPREPTGPASPGDALVIWNRYGRSEQIANRFEREGGTVFCAENGYLGAGGEVPKYAANAGAKPGLYYALALSQHNGAGRWKTGDAQRFRQLGVNLTPWRAHGEHVLVCPSRGIGSAKLRPPSNWLPDTVKAIQACTKRPVRVRHHPGNEAPKKPLEADLANAWAVVIWSSSAGVHALVRGIPVLCLAGAWICRRAAYTDVKSIDEPHVSITEEQRLAAMNDLAWSQFTLEEIASGKPFRHLLSDAR